MGSSDIPPSSSPPWLIPAHILLMTIGVLCWDATYILMTLRALETRSYGMPLGALAVNISWEIVYVFYVCEAPLETLGFLVWLTLDLGLVYTTLRFGPSDWSRSRWPWVGRRIGVVLGLLTAGGCAVHHAFARWFLAVPGRTLAVDGSLGVGMDGMADKRGKWWKGEDGFDTTEAAFWSAGVSQVCLSLGCLVMLWSRGHSGGTGWTIWACRATGSIFGLVLSQMLLWWYWPAAHGYMITPAATCLWGTAAVCDVVYPSLLWRVRRTEHMLLDGRLVSGKQGQASEKKDE